MIAYLESLARLPGVEFVMLISHDGVPIAHAGGTEESAREESLAALAASWLNDVTQAVAPLGWHAPERVCLRAARGTLVMRRSESACLVVRLGREAAPEDVRLSMDGTLARIERARHGRTHAPLAPGAPSAALVTAQESEPAGPIPYRNDAPLVEEQLRPAPGRPPGT
ncbi:MAG: roadblock/LC7 domain-containing protein [Planctomycetes bacterium]|nr:roadblock/LC7 domain-containing protein [Planctomycetota bacterium]